MKKVVFLFMSQGAAFPGTIERRVYPTKSCGDKYNQDFAGECYFKMLKELLDNRIISDLKIFFESNVEPGIANWITGENIYCEVIPEIRFIDEYIDKDTIIFARGGFKHWHDWLLRYKNKNWLMLYAANTGREKWEFWDIVLDDLRENLHFLDTNGRYWFPFVKPISENMFYPEDIPYCFDICIGASHIHDKKGQWRISELLKLYQEKYNKKLKAIMPGSFRRGEKTLKMIEDVKSRNVDIYLPGMVSRQQLRKIYNQSKIFISPGPHGQNDRGLLEAISCGCSVITLFVKNHSPLLCNINTPYYVYFKNWKDDLEQIHVLSEEVNSMLTDINTINKPINLKEMNVNFYKNVVGNHRFKIAKLFSFIGENDPTILNKEKFLKSNNGFKENL